MEDIKRGRIALPRFQRKFVWKDDTISDLIFAIIKEKPVGALLVMKNHGANGIFRPWPIKGSENYFNQKKYENDGIMMILDGQQRLTAIWCALNGVFSKEEDKRNRRGFFMKFDKEKIDLNNPKFQNFITGVICKKMDQAEKHDNPDKYFFEKGLIPVSLLFSEDRHKIRDWFKAVCENKEIFEKIYREIEECNFRFNGRDISYYTLPEKTEIGEVIQTFIKINTSSSKMSIFDIAVACIEDLNIQGSNEDRFRDWIDEINLDQGRMERYFPSENRISEIGELILKVACLLTKEKENSRPFIPTEKNYTEKEVVKTVINRWNDIVRGIDCTLEFMEMEGIYDSKRLPSEVPLRVLPALYADFPKDIDPDKDGYRNQLIRKYLWRSFFTERYDSAAETRLHQDYMELYKIIGKIYKDDSFDQSAEGIFDEDRYPIPNSEMLSNFKKRLKKPTMKSKIPRALLILSLKRGAIDIASDEKITPSNIGLRQYHHLFPKKMLKDEGRDDIEINHPLNFALIQANSNKRIAAKKPKDYLFQRRVGDAEEEDIRERVESHLIPYDELNVETGKGHRYEKFIKRRADLFESVLKELCEGKKWPK
ncbi:MAG: DUF262 domain-containing protein [Ectothiorhodospiraceae bacterium AqS1]|nr:DUF262 domain-containing protein [Ectothiorhodospiraceae bacterium AqS1]